MALSGYFNPISRALKSAEQQQNLAETTNDVFKLHVFSGFICFPLSKSDTDMLH
jgi:hypothetical protein